MIPMTGMAHRRFTRRRVSRFSLFQSVCRLKCPGP